MISNGVMISERINAGKKKGQRNDLEKFNLSHQPQVGAETLHARPGCVLVAVRDYQRMLHLHFEYLERTHEGYLLTDEHNLMLEAIRAKDVERADDLAHAHTRQFQNNFIEFMRENYTTDVTLRPLSAAE